MTSHRPSALPLRRLLLLLLVSIFAVSSRSVRLSDPVSNGLGKPLGRGSPPYILSSAASSDSCDETYGFMPCTTTWIGNLFLILVYGYLMYTAAKCVSAGSEMLLESLGPGLIGGLVLPMLGALPDALLILVSGLSGSTETAQSQVSIGMGLLAGSTVMLLTVVWGSCVLVGKCDLQNSTAVDKLDTTGFSLTGSGITIDNLTRRAAWIMVISVIPFLVIQVQLLNSTSARHVAVLMVLILSVALLISYCLYQVFQPQIQKRRLQYWEQRHIVFGFLRHVKKRAIGRLMKDDGEVDTEIVDKIFETIDTDNDNHLTASELKAFVIGIRFEEIDLDLSDAVDKIMAAFDPSHDDRLSKEEFGKGINEWLKKAVRSGKGSNLKNVVDTMKIIDHTGQQAKKEREQLLVWEQSEVEVEVVENVKMTSLKAVGLLILGTVIAAAFADPLVDAVDNFSDATGIPTFFISFIVLPLATGAGEAVMAISVASRKEQKIIMSLTFSEFYGRVTVKNLLCLAVFLVLVYIRGLTWDFTSEVIAILIVCIVMGIFASFRATYPLWTSLVAFVLYPFSLALVYVLNRVLGWL